VQKIWLVVVAAGAVVLTGCGGGGSSAAPSTSFSTIVTTVTSSASTTPTGPLDTQSVTATTAASCALVSTDSAADSIGMRLARVEVLTRGTTSAGCRFYALQGTALSQSEHLPGPNQPALEIVSTAYANETTARNAAVAIATAGTNQQVVTLTGGVAADLFQAAFDPTDGSNDWQLVFNKGATLVTIKTAVTDSSLDAVDVANSIVAAV
jgi:hypothetical protein